jgi:hypothetical protein
MELKTLMQQIRIKLQLMMFKMLKTTQDVPISNDGEQVINIIPQEVHDAPTTQEEESQFVYEKHNVLNENIGEDDVLLPQESNYQAPTDLRKVYSHPLSSVIDDPRDCVRIRSKMNKMIINLYHNLSPKISKMRIMTHVEFMSCKMN